MHLSYVTAKATEKEKLTAHFTQNGAVDRSHPTTFPLPLLLVKQTQAVPRCCKSNGTERQEAGDDQKNLEELWPGLHEEAEGAGGSSRQLCPSAGAEKSLPDCLREV